MNNYCYIKITSLLLIFFVLAHQSIGQSKKEKIEALIYQKDSLVNLLSINNKLHKEEISKLNLDKKNLETKIDVLTKKNENALNENLILKNTVASQNSRLDSIFNLKYGELLTPSLDADEDSIFYFLNLKTIELPNSNVIPVGWNKDGVFAYYEIIEDGACGKCSGSLNLFDAQNNVNLDSYSYELHTLDNYGKLDADLIKKMKSDKQKEFSKYSITSLSDDLKMNFIKSSDESLLVDNKILKIEKKNGMGILFSVNPIGEKNKLFEIKLNKVYNENILMFSEEDILINGCFYNPLNRGQLIIHLIYSIPGGYENENRYYNFFVSLII